MFHQGWENTELGPCLHQEVSYQAGQYSPHHLGAPLNGQGLHYAPHHYSTHPLSCGCQPLGRCWRSCQAAHMPHVLRHIDNLVGPPPPPVLVPAGDHEEDHAEYINTTGVGSSEVQDRCEQVILCEPQSVQLCDPHAACLAASVSQGAVSLLLVAGGCLKLFF